MYSTCDVQLNLAVTYNIELSFVKVCIHFLVDPVYIYIDIYMYMYVKKERKLPLALCGEAILNRLRTCLETQTTA